VQDTTKGRRMRCVFVQMSRNNAACADLGLSSVYLLTATPHAVELAAELLRKFTAGTFNVFV